MRVDGHVVVELEFCPHQPVREPSRFDAEWTDVSRNLFTVFRQALAKDDFEDSIAGLSGLALDQCDEMRRERARRH